LYFYKNSSSDCSVTVPDVPGCFSAGEAMSEALDKVREALALHFNRSKQYVCVASAEWKALFPDASAQLRR